MSRIGKQPVTIPAKVQVDIKGNEVSVKGPKGQLSMVAHPEMHIKTEDGILHVERPSDARRHRELHGLTRALIANMVTGVTTGYRKTLVVEGVGYRAEMQGKNLMMYLGYSHPVEVIPPDGITFAIEERGRLVYIDGIDRQLVGQIAANVRNLRAAGPYKGEGVCYDDETIRRKDGKAGKGK